MARKSKTRVALAPRPFDPGTVGPDDLYVRFPCDSEPRPVHLSLYLTSGVFEVHADEFTVYGEPLSVVHGVERRYRVPILTVQAADQLLADLAPLAQTVLDGAILEHDASDYGNCCGATLNADATAAEQAIRDAVAALWLDDSDTPVVLEVKP